MHAPHARVHMLLRFEIGLRAGQTRRLGGIQQFIVSEVEWWHGAKFIRRQKHQSIQ